MSPLKASGEDGLGVIFYQRFWAILSNDIAEYYIALIKGEVPLATVNHTHIVLILKINSIRSMLNFRPISLCNVLYKIASKALVNRFQEVLQFCIDQPQSTFVLGHLISNNIIATYKILHFMKSRKVGKEGSFALVTTVSYSVVINGRVGDKFIPSRGLRQGDSLIPYLFLFYGEGLLTLIRIAEVRGVIRGV